MVETRAISQWIYDQHQIPCETTHDNAEGREHIGWENISFLTEEGVINTKYGFRNILKGEKTDTGDELFRVEWASFPTANIGYIHWTEVHRRYQRKGIGSYVRQSVVDSLSRFVSRIFTDAHSPAGQGLITSQDFTEWKNSTTIPSWYILETP